MSFLEEIRAKKNALNATETIITQLDGRRYVEIGENAVEAVRIPYGFVVDTKPDDVPAKIIPHVYLGSQDCCDFRVLKAHNLSHVLSVGIEAPTKCEGVIYKFVPCLDLPQTDLSDVLNDCNDFIKGVVNVGGNVLVHCNAGVSRSPSIVIGYLMRIHRYTYSEAFDFVKKARSCIRPNDGFEKQLKKIIL